MLCSESRENIIVVVVVSKENSLLEGRPLLADTDGSEFDSTPAGYVRIITGFEDYAPTEKRMKTRSRGSTT